MAEFRYGRLTDKPLNAVFEAEVFAAENTLAGAIVTFTGNVRAASNMEAVYALDLQAYSPMTEDGIEAAIREAKQRWYTRSVRVVHRIGRVEAAKPIVFVAVAADHRREAFEAADFLMDYLKTRAVFWKKEIRSSGAHWIEPREEDYADATRWIKEGADAPD